MLEKLRLVEERYLETAERMAQPEFYNDPKAAAKLMKEQKQLEPIMAAYREFRRISQEQQELPELMALDAEMK